MLFFLTNIERENIEYHYPYTKPYSFFSLDSQLTEDF